MSGAHRRAEFFALEASEYLAELEPLAARTEPPDLERLVRGARALRGAALMAGLGTFARAAAALEAIARHVRDHALGWEPHARPAWREGLQTLRGLVARATVWEAADDRHALALAERLERAASGQAAETTPPPRSPAAMPTAEKGPALSPGVRAFIARESELIASSLLEASRALEPMAPATALSGVLDRLRSLRGVGSAGELSPLPELLDAMEATTRSMLDNPDPPPGVAGVFADAADALAAMARSVADDGHVLVPAGLDHVAERLLAAFSQVQPPPAIGTAVAGPGGAEPVPIELVGVGDHLRLQAESLGRYTSPAARTLRLFVLHRTLSTMPVKGGTGNFLSPLVAVLARAIQEGEAVAAPDRFVTQLRECGDFLVDAASDRDATSRNARRDEMLVRLGGVPVDNIIAIESLAPDAPEPPVISIESLAPDDVISIESLAPDDDVVSIESLAPDDVVSIEALAPDDDVVSMESLAPDDAVISIESLAPDVDVVSIESLAPDDDVVSIESLAPDVVAGQGLSSGRLEAAYRRRSALRREAGVAAPSLDALLRGDRMVTIDELLYRGDGALVRAEEVRRELTALLAESSPSLDRLRPLLDELLDLVPLARDAA